MVETENIVCNDWNLNFQIVQNHLNFLLGPSVKKINYTVYSGGILWVNETKTLQLKEN